MDKDMEPPLRHQSVFTALTIPSVPSFLPRPPLPCPPAPPPALPANDLSSISLVLPFWEACLFGILQHGAFPDEFLSLSDVLRSVPRNIVNEIRS